MHFVLRKIHSWIVGYYYLLLFCLILLFVFRPYENNPFYVGVWKLLLSTVILSAVFTVKHTRKIQIAASCLAVPAVALAWLDLMHPSPFFFVSNASITALFFFLCTYSILCDVVLRAKVTLETLRGVICAYFMIAFAFAYSYYLVEYLSPNSFHFIGESTSTIYDYSRYYSQLLYFSFITLLTIGYGDITALKSVGQTLCVIEGTIGQFYIAILVARLVSVYSLYSDKRVLDLLDKTLDRK